MSRVALSAGWQTANSNAQTDNNLRGMQSPLPVIIDDPASQMVILKR
jgi:hypothetical protein